MIGWSKRQHEGDLRGCVDVPLRDIGARVSGDTTIPAVGRAPYPVAQSEPLPPLRHYRHRRTEFPPEPSSSHLPHPSRLAAASCCSANFGRFPPLLLSSPRAFDWSCNLLPRIGWSSFALPLLWQAETFWDSSHSLSYLCYTLSVPLYLYSLLY